MCGILAIYSPNRKLAFDEETIISALSKIEHRGPDSMDIVIDEGIVLGHVRLEIIDSDGGKQPFIKDNLELVFN